MTILELREKRAKAWEAAKAFLDSHRNDKGILSAEDDAAYTRMEQEITDLGKEIARLERQEALDAELNRPVNKPLTGKPMNGAYDYGVDEHLYGSEDTLLYRMFGISHCVYHRGSTPACFIGVYRSCKSETHGHGHRNAGKAAYGCVSCKG